MPPVTAAAPTRRRALPALVALVLLLAGFRLVPPFAFALLVPIVAVGEASPLVALVALGLVAVALVRRPRRSGLAAAALLAAVVAGAPWVDARSAARAGAAAVAALRVPPPAGPRTDSVAASPVVGPGAPGERAPGEGVPAERVVRYAAADGTLLAARLFLAHGAGRGPTFVVFYGGAWRTGDAGQCAALHRRLAAQGYTVVALDYRHAPAHRFPAQLNDARLGLRLVRDSAAAWGVDPARLVLWGRSSGAHLALLAAWADTGRAAPPIRGVIDYYGPVDLAEGYRHPPRPDPIGARAVLQDFLGGTPADAADRYRDASPLAHVRPELPPTLLIYGGRDHLVEARFGRALAEALAAAGDPVAYVELPWAEHGFDAAPGGVGERVATALARQFAARVTKP